jgi:hypothetical protein
LEAATQLDEGKAAEIQKLVGDAYFNKDRYAESIPYLEHFAKVKGKGQMSREDQYRLAFAYQRSEQWQKAVDGYSGAKSKEDLLGQMAAYNEGLCYIKMDNKR